MICEDYEPLLSEKAGQYQHGLGSSIQGLIEVILSGGANWIDELALITAQAQISGMLTYMRARRKAA